MKRHTILIMFAAVLTSFLMLVARPALAQGVAFAEVTAAHTPWDAAPSPDGKLIYFTAIGADGAAGVFAIPDSGGEVRTLAAGAPFAMPLGIAVSSDGGTLYVTDPWAAGQHGNAVFAVGADGAVERIAGTEGTAPQGIEVVNRNGSDVLYFTGINPADGQPAVYSIEEGAATLLAQGAPLVAPSGITAGADGAVYVLDRLASGGGLGSVLRIRDGVVETIASGVHTGAQLAGMALTLDESLLLVSSLDGGTGTSQVLVVNLATLETSTINDVIGVNTAAGGLHRAHDANIFAWIDNTGGSEGRGRIYCVKVGG